jgi:hypothetical protein
MRYAETTSPRTASLLLETRLSTATRLDGKGRGDFEWPYSRIKGMRLGKRALRAAWRPGTDTRCEQMYPNEETTELQLPIKLARRILSYFAQYYASETAPGVIINCHHFTGWIRGVDSRADPLEDAYMAAVAIAVPENRRTDDQITVGDVVVIGAGQESGAFDPALHSAVAMPGGRAIGVMAMCGHMGILNIDHMRKLYGQEIGPYELRTYALSALQDK